ncbi:ABC-type sugar transport system, permease component [Halobacteroides halobius DSM 5150]|uniref:ABC-type sugar transport system, permease component n=1 Tax=Halobacteroides halobius (strain ATCC 35273 / DSM 5150 / MD-1) TaxID=748449 RepID=L0KAC7_HALHC|nr:carbohydrate ABC transporter permease [Halobacteroides halobius]AGB41495.1 ABC-type sugar transport system, permease component [Halobacteroides halobius DSM 5150]
MNNTEDLSGKLADIFYIPALILGTLFMILPVYLMFKVSVSSPQEVLTQHPTFGIQNFTLEHWKGVIQSGRLWAPLSKSFIVATGTAIISMIIAAPGAYVISRMDRKIKYITIISLFFTRMFPAVGIALPVSVEFIKLGLLDTNLGLILAHLIKVLPFLAWILVGTFETIPQDLEKAASVDGASKMQILLKVVFPIALPGIAVGTMFAWLQSWNEFTYALYMTLADKTLPLQVFYYVNRGGVFATAAYATILTIPVAIITFFLQKYMKSGYLSGAIKG